jgi:MFS family permease
MRRLSPRHPFARLSTLDPNVRRLGIVSFLADVSSEIAYPLFPLFVTGVLGVPVALLGLIEGIAEATASITKYPFGQAADFSGRRRPFVLAGYTLGGLGKLVIALAAGWPLALTGRFVDRLGKGMRTAPRDDLIAANTRPEQQGLAFGLHRTMDTLGAVLGPLIALALWQAHVPLRWIFAIAVLPGLLSVLAIVLFVREHREQPSPTAFRLSLPASPAFRWLLAGSLLFAVGNSSDAFILLKAKTVLEGTHSAYITTSLVILLYVLYNVTYSAASLPLGGLSDRVGQFPLVITGYAVFIAVYLGFAAAGSGLVLAALFAVYGLYIAATEGTSKALISRVIPTGERASALGLYYTATGMASFAASAVGGVLWSAVGPWATFVYGAVAATAAATLMLSGHGKVRRALR